MNLNRNLENLICLNFSAERIDFQFLIFQVAGNIFLLMGKMPDFALWKLSNLSRNERSSAQNQTQL